MPKSILAGAKPLRTDPEETYESIKLEWSTID